MAFLTEKGKSLEFTSPDFSQEIEVQRNDGFVDINIRIRNKWTCSTLTKEEFEEFKKAIQEV